MKNVIAYEKLEAAFPMSPRTGLNKHRDCKRVPRKLKKKLKKVFIPECLGTSLDIALWCYRHQVNPDHNKAIMKKVISDCKIERGGEYRGIYTS